MKFSILKKQKWWKNKAGKFYKPSFFTLENFIIFKIFHEKQCSIKFSILQIIKLSILKNVSHLKFCLWNFLVFRVLAYFISQSLALTRVSKSFRPILIFGNPYRGIFLWNGTLITYWMCLQLTGKENDLKRSIVDCSDANIVRRSI